MKAFRTFMLAAGAAAALGAHPSADQITAADRAIVDTSLVTCAPQLAAMKQELAAHGETTNDAEARQFFESMLAEARQMAAYENVTVLETLRAAQVRLRELINDPANPDPSLKVGGPSMLCFYDVLIARETGGTSPGPAPEPDATPPAPAPSPAPAVSTAQSMHDTDGCLTIDWAGGGHGAPATINNGCSHAMNVGICISEATPGSASEDVACERSRFTSYFIAGRGAVTVPATHGSVKSIACRAPNSPAMWWENGASLGNCR